jgi:hypothetical protein
MSLCGGDLRALVRPLPREDLLAAMQADLTERWKGRMVGGGEWIGWDCAVDPMAPAPVGSSSTSL